MVVYLCIDDVDYCIICGSELGVVVFMLVCMWWVLCWLVDVVCGCVWFYFVGYVVIEGLL